MNCFRSLKFSVVVSAALLHVAFSCASTFETWQKTEDSALAATKAAHFLDAEKLLLANQKLCETFPPKDARSEEHTSELQSRRDLVCRLLLEKKKKNKNLY